MRINSHTRENTNAKEKQQKSPSVWKCGNRTVLNILALHFLLKSILLNPFQMWKLETWVECMPSPVQDIVCPSFTSCYTVTQDAVVSCQHLQCSRQLVGVGVQHLMLLSALEEMITSAWPIRKPWMGSLNAGPRMCTSKELATLSSQTKDSVLFSSSNSSRAHPLFFYYSYGLD